MARDPASVIILNDTIILMTARTASTVIGKPAHSQTYKPATWNSCHSQSILRFHSCVWAFIFAAASIFSKCYIPDGRRDWLVVEEGAEGL